jgi:serine/threonine protein kinase
MSIALSEFWTRLVQNGVASTDQCKQFAAAYCDAHQGTPATDAESMAAFLVKSGQLTKFQSTALLSDTPVSLRQGSFVQTSDQPSMPLGHWLPVQALASAVNDSGASSPSDSPRKGFLLRVPGTQLTELVSQWLAAHAAVSHPQLQGFELHPDGEGGVQVFSPLEGGRSLFDLTKKKMKVARAQAMELSISIANGLSAMHAAGLVHGEVRSDRIWMTSGGKATLLRDPSGPARVPRADPAFGWIHATEAAGAYAAPELADPNQPCSVASDIYSFGCLMFRMFVGRLPMEDASGSGTQTDSQSSIDQQIADHLTHVPAELTQAIQQGEAGDPLLRVIAYAMAKSPAARFSSAQQVADALTAVQASLSSASPSSTSKQTKQPKSAVKEVSSDASPDVDAATRTPAIKTGKTQTQLEQPTQRKPAQSSPAQSSPAQSKPKPTQPKPPQSSPVASSPAQSPPVASSRATADSVPPPQPPKPQTPAQEPPAQEPPAQEPSAQTRPSEEAESTSPPPPRRRRRKKKNNVPFILGMLSIPLLATFIMLLARGNGSTSEKRDPRPPLPTVVPPVASSTRAPERKVASRSTVKDTTPAASANGYQLVSDGKFPWAPPYAADAKQPSLELLPPGPAAIVSVQLGSFVADPAGREVLAALSPELTGLIKQASQRAGVPQSDIERITVALHPDRNGWPEVSMVIELSEAQALKALADTWQVSAARTPDGVTIYAGDEPDADAYFLGDSQKGALAPDATVRRFAVGSIKRIKTIAENEGGSIPLPRAMQKLWDGSSRSSHVVALVTPNFLFADGRELLATAAPELTRPLKRLLITDFAGVLVSLTANDDVFYSELRAVPSGNVSSAALMRTLSSAFDSWPGWADKFSVDAMPDRSWRLLANRLPQMMRFVVEQTRFGVEDDIVVANNYLPAGAASQVAVASLLAMNTKPGDAAVTSASSTKPTLTVDEMLDRKMSISFDQLSLEFAINAVADEFAASLPAGSTMPEVRIIGSDLQKMGITQNQQIRDFNRKEIPLRTILTDIVLGANPDKTATGANDPKQSLVWVVHEESGKTVILVTTRVASKGNYELPAEFKAG